jgi:hypothetical protein
MIRRPIAFPSSFGSVDHSQNDYDTDIETLHNELLEAAAVVDPPPPSLEKWRGGDGSYINIDAFQKRDYVSTPGETHNFVIPFIPKLRTSCFLTKALTNCVGPHHGGQTIPS